MTVIPTIDPLPAPPQRGQDPAVFIQLADAFLDALPGFGDDLNAFGVALLTVFADLSAAKFTATSSTQVAIGTGARTFAATPGVAFSPGQTVLIASASDASYNMQGPITSYASDTGALIVNVTVTSGSGTRGDWKIGLVPSDIEARLATFKTDVTDPIVTALYALSNSLGTMSTRNKAVMAELYAWTADKGVTADLVGSAFAQVALAYAPSLAWDWRGGFYRGPVVCAGNVTINTPTNIRAGETRVMTLKGDGATARTVSFSSAFKGALPTIADMTSTKPYRLVVFADSSTELTADARALA